MNPLFYAAIGLTLASIAVTVHAVLSAGDGYEDEKGFHSVKSALPPKASAPKETNEESPIPPCLPAH